MRDAQGKGAVWMWPQGCRMLGGVPMDAEQECGMLGGWVPMDTASEVGCSGGSLWMQDRGCRVLKGVPMDAGP